MPSRLFLHLLFITAAPGLVAPAALGQAITTSSSFHGDAIYSQAEQFFLETRVLAEIIDDLGTVTIYDQTFTNSYIELTDHQEFAEGDSMAEFVNEKSAAEARVTFPQPGNLSFIGTPGPPDVSAAIAEATMLLTASAPGAVVDRTDESTANSTRSIFETSFSSRDTVTTTFFPDPTSGPDRNIHTHTDVNETFLVRQDTRIETTIRLSADTAANTVPEPQTIAIWVLLGVGVAGFTYFRRRRNQS